MTRYPSRQIRDLDKLVKRYGWTWALTKHGNVRWLGPRGQTVTTGTNPSWRSMKNSLANFYRAGVPRNDIQPKARRPEPAGKGSR